MNTKRRHWVVDVAIAARDEALARDRANPLAATLRQITATFDTLMPVFEQIGRTIVDAVATLAPPQPPRHAGPVRDVVHEHRPRRHT